MKRISQHSYKNAEQFKFKNTRIEIVSLPNEDYGIKFKILSKDTSPRTIHIVEKNKIVTTIMRISSEAALSIMLGLQDQLRKDGIICEN